MAGYLTTHVLDTARGVPASGIQIDLYRVSETIREHLAQFVTNHDGRTDAPILPEQDFATGQYELVFHCGAYIDEHGAGDDAPQFLSEIPIRFGMSDPTAHYHVPLLLSPFGYSTYRGS